MGRLRAQDWDKYTCYLKFLPLDSSIQNELDFLNGTEMMAGELAKKGGISGLVSKDVWINENANPPPAGGTLTTPTFKLPAIVQHETSGYNGFTGHPLFTD